LAPLTCRRLRGRLDQPVAGTAGTLTEAVNICLDQASAARPAGPQPVKALAAGVDAA
jgi:hypothetical protein